MSISRAVQTLRIGRGSAGIRLSTAEFDAITRYDNRYRYELIDGVLVVNPIPSEAEGDPNEELGHWLRHYKDTHPQGSALDKTLFERYVFTDNRRRADRVIWAGLGRVPDPDIDMPTIVVEFVSRGKRNHHRDYVEKRQEYLAAGVQEYWLIDRFRRLMVVATMKSGKIADLTVGENDSYQTPLLPGFELPLAKLLAVADDWRGKR